MNKFGFMMSCGLVLGTVPVVVVAQDVADAKQAQARKDEDVTVVKVTAQRRSQSLMDVPLGITVVSAADLKGTKATTVKDIQTIAPSLIFSETPGQPAFKMRGVGSAAFDYSVEQAVGVLLDDVAQTVPRAPALNTLIDVDHVEVLRGPQGTLFGRNSTAGVVAISTRKPRLGVTSNEFHVQAGTKGERQVYDIANVPLSEKAAARVAVVSQQRDHVLKVVGPGSVEDQHDKAFTAKLLFEPTEALSLYGIFSHQKSVADPGAFAIRSLGAGTFAPGVGNQFIRTSLQTLGITPGPDNDRGGQGSDNFQRVKGNNGQLTANYSLGNHTLTSVSAYRSISYLSKLEVDSTPFHVLDNNTGGGRAHQASQEFRFANDSGGAIEYVAGLYFHKQKVRFPQRNSGGLGYLPEGAPIELAAAGQGLADGTTRMRSTAVFSDLTYNATAQLKVFGGLRATRDRNGSDVFYSQIPGVCNISFLSTRVCNPVSLPTAPRAAESVHSDWSGRLGAQYNLPDNAMVYASVARGYKGSGYGTLSGTPIEIKPETVVSVEAGLKKEFFDRKASLSATVFNSRYTDFQTEVFDPTINLQGAFRTGNAGGLRSRGVELEMLARPIAGLNTRASLSYIDAEFTEYKPSCWPGQTAAQGCTLPGPTFDAAGERLTNAPRFTVSLGAGYQTPVSESLKLNVGANWYYRSSVYFGVGNPSTRQEGYGLLGLNAGVGSLNDSWTLGVYVRNALDKRYTVVIFPTFFDIGGYSQVIPQAAYRTLGASLTLRF